MSSENRQGTAERRRPIALNGTTFRCATFVDTAGTLLTIQWTPTVVLGHHFLFAENARAVVLTDALVTFLGGDALTIFTAWVGFTRARSIDRFTTAAEVGRWTCTLRSLVVDDAFSTVQTGDVGARCVTDRTFAGELTVVTSVSCWTITAGLILKNLTATAVLTRVGKTWVDYGDDGRGTWTDNTGTDRSRCGCGDQSFAVAARERKRALTDVTSCCGYAMTTVVTWIRNAIVTDFTTQTVVAWCTRANVGGWARGCASTAVEAWLRNAWIRGWQQDLAASSRELRWALALKGITGDQAETTVQTWIGITHALFTLDTSETDLADTSKEIRSSYLTGATVEAWTGVARIGSGQVDFAAHTAEADGTRATESSLAKVASTAVLTWVWLALIGWWKNDNRCDLALEAAEARRATAGHCLSDQCAHALILTVGRAAELFRRVDSRDFRIEIFLHGPFECIDVSENGGVVLVGFCAVGADDDINTIFGSGAILHQFFAHAGFGFW